MEYYGCEAGGCVVTGGGGATQTAIPEGLGFWRFGDVPFVVGAASKIAIYCLYTRNG